MNLRSTKISTARKISRLMWMLNGRKKFIGKKIPVLGYHRVLPEFVESGTPMYSVLPHQFKTQMRYLAENGFTSLSLTEYDEIIRGVRDVPERAVLLTFDDGYADIYSVAWPIAQRYGIKLNIFICTGFVQSDNAFIYPRMPYHAFNHRTTFPNWWRPLNWQEIRAMHEQGVEIGFHGHTHRKMASLSSMSVHHEFAVGLKLCQEYLGETPRFFAFPHGTPDSYDEKTIELAKHYGMQRIFTTRLRRTAVDARTELISRLIVHQEDDLNAFELKLFGAYDWLGDLRYFGQQYNLIHETTYEELKPSHSLSSEEVIGD